MSTVPAPVLEFEDFRVDPTRRRLLKQGQPLAITSKAFDVLLTLVTHAGRLVTKDEVMAAVWPDCMVEESNLTVAVCLLRRVLGETSHEHRFIVTVPGRGYQFVAPVKTVPVAAEPVELIPTPSVSVIAAPSAEVIAASSVRMRVNGRIASVAAALVAAVVGACLHVVLFDTARAPRRASDGTPQEAHRLYVKGRHLLSDRTEAGILKGRDFFERAIQIDPTYAPAYAGRADAYSLLGNLGFMAPRDAFPVAKASAEQALKLDDRLAEAHAALGYVRHRFDWDWQGAEREFRRALDLRPEYGEARHWYAHFLRAMGRRDEAFVEGRRAWQASPLSPVIGANLGSMFTWAGHHEAAIALCREVLEVEPDSWLGYRHLARAYARGGYDDLAVDAYRTAIDLSNEHAGVVGELALLLASIGDRAGARELLAQLEAVAERRYVSSYQRAAVHLELGERERALDLLEQAFDERATALVFLTTERSFDSLRTDLRFVTLLRKIGLG